MTALELIWRKSRRCDTNACVEAADAGDQVLFRNSADPDGPSLSFTKEEWADIIGDMIPGDLRFPD